MVRKYEAALTLRRQHLFKLLKGDYGKPKAPGQATGCRGQPLLLPDAL